MGEEAGARQRLGINGARQGHQGADSAAIKFGQWP